MTTGQHPHRTSGYYLSAVSGRKLSWFGHVCGHDTLPKITTLNRMRRTKAKFWSCFLIRQCCSIALSFVCLSAALFVGCGQTVQDSV